MKKRWKRWGSAILTTAMVFSWTATAWAGTARAVETGEQLYYNDFTDEHALDGWTKTNCQIVEGKLQASSTTSALCVGTPAEVDQGDYVITSTVTVDAQEMTGGTSAGLVFRATDTSNFLHFRLNASDVDGKDAQLYGMYGGKMSRLAEAAFDWSAGKEYTLTVQCQGETIQCYVDHALVLEYTDSRYQASSVGYGIGYRIWGCTAAFDELTVSQPYAEETEPQPLEVTMAKTEGVSVYGPVVLQFSAELSENTISGIAVADGNENQVEADVVLREGGRVVWITPRQPLKGEHEYQVWVPTSVEDVQGNTCPQEQVLSFRTGKDRETLPLLDNAQGQVELSLNGLWYFAADPNKVGVAERWYAVNQPQDWERFAVPGNWDLENEYANYRGTGWYHRTFHVDEEYEGYPAYLNLTAVYHDSRIWINGCEVGSHDGGYTTFEFRVDDYLRYGEENTIAIEVNNEFSYGAWWKWGGISGDALLRINNTSKLEWQHISTDVDLEGGKAELNFQYKINNQSNTERTYTVVSQVYDKATGELVGQQSTPVTVAPTSEQEDQRFDSAPLTLEQPKLWNLDAPNLYTVKTWLKDGEQVVHDVQDDIGIRKIEIIDTKFYLNGEAVRLTGANRVWDDRANGQTEPDYVIMRDIDYMKSMGMNCARLSHVPMSKNLLDYCDEVGFLLICEGNLWGGGGVAQVTNPQGSEYPYRVVQWYKEMIERDYNHPSIFAWSIGNELSGNQKIVKDYAKYMVNYIKTELDDTRYVTEVSLSAHRPNNPDNPMGDSVYYSDFICCNYYGGFRGNVEKIHNTYPDKAIFVSEYGNGQTSEVPDKAVINPKRVLDEWGDLPYVFGASIWTLNDYRSNYQGTPLGQNRVWGVTTVWGEKKIGFEALRQAASPVNALTVRLSGDVLTAGGNALLVFGVQTRDGSQELPAYALEGAVLKWEARDPQGQMVDSGLVDIPDLLPDGSTWQSAAALKDIPPEGVGVLRVTVIDAMGYELAETFHYLQAPSRVPPVKDVIAGEDGVRVLFDEVEQAQEYRVTITGAGNSQTVVAKLNGYADFTGLTTGETYTVTIQAINPAGEGPVSEQIEVQLKENTGTLPPIIWHTESAEHAFFVGYSVKNVADSYELEYGTTSGVYTQTMTFATEGSVKVSGLTAGTTYYYRLRSITNGVPSQWSQEETVSVEQAQQVRDIPVVTGAAAGEDQVSLTIQPTWKATGYTVRYGKDPEQLTQSVYIHRAEVEQLMVEGLERGETYWFAVSAHNGGVQSEFSQPICATTQQEAVGDVVVVSVDASDVALNAVHSQGSIELDVASTFDQDRALNVKVEYVPEGIQIPEQETFQISANSNASFSLPVFLLDEVEKGNYPVVVTVTDGDTVLARQAIKIKVCQVEMMLEDEFEASVDGRYAQSGNGGAGTVTDGVFRITNTSGSGAPIFTAGDAQWQGYIVESDVTLTNKDNLTSGVSGGLVFRYQDDKNFCHARLDVGQGDSKATFQVYRWENGKAKELYRVPLQGAWNDTYHLQVVDLGGPVVFYVNQERMTQLDLGQGSGKIGYRVYAAHAEMDNLKVYRTLCPAQQVVVCFDSMGGTPLAPVMVDLGGVAEQPTVPVKEGFRFVRWYLDQACTIPYDFAAPVTESLTLYAGWTPVEPDPAPSVEPTDALPSRPVPSATPEPGDETGGNVETGDEASVMVWWSMLLGAVCALVLVSMKFKCKSDESAIER